MNIEKKKEFRKKVEELLEKVPEGKRVNLKPEILNELLFDEFVLIPEDNEKVKLPTWSGDFLSKIDLSEVSFDNVSWSSLSLEPPLFPYSRDEFNEPLPSLSQENCQKGSMYYSEKLFRKFADVLGENYEDHFDIGPFTDENFGPAFVNYSNTNAKIDFLKSWEAKKTGKIILHNCNFNNVNLSNLDFSKVYQITYCNMNNSNIKISSQDFKNIKWYEVDLSNNDLSELVINYLDECISWNLSGTGAKIDIDFLKEIKDYDRELIEEILSRYLEFGIWNGCYYKDIMIQNSEENIKEFTNFMLTGKSKQELAEDELRKQYDEENMVSVIEDLEEQINGFGK